MSNKQEISNKKSLIILVIINYVFAGMLYLFSDMTEGEIWIMVLWPIIAFIFYIAIKLSREYERPTPVIFKNPDAMKKMNNTTMNYLDEQNLKLNKDLESEKQKVKDLTLLVESKEILIEHMQKEIEVYQNQVAELIKKIK